MRSALYGLLIGAVIGMVAYAMQGGRRDFASVTVMRRQRYEVVVVDDEAADRAARLFGQGA
jgi:hypothetical protein